MYNKNKDKKQLNFINNRQDHNTDNIKEILKPETTKSELTGGAFSSDAEDPAKELNSMFMNYKPMQERRPS